MHNVMSILNPEKVNALFLSCQMGQTALQRMTSPSIQVGGVEKVFEFDRARVNRYAGIIREMLERLPASHQGEGDSFVTATRDCYGQLWGSVADVEKLVCLGIALGAAKYCVKRSAWRFLPAKLPYFKVTL